MKSRKIRRVVSVTLSVALIAGNSGLNADYAMEPKGEQIVTIGNYNEVTPFWSEIYNITPSLSAKGTTLYPEVYVDAIKSSGSISGTMYLEKNSSGSWTNVTSWSFSGTGSAFLAKSYRGTSGTKYRVRVVATVNSEKGTAYSKSVDI